MNSILRSELINRILDGEKSLITQLKTRKIDVINDGGAYATDELREQIEIFSRISGVEEVVWGVDEFIGCEFEHVNLSSIDISCAQFIDTNLYNSDFSQSTLDRAGFYRCNLNRASFFLCKIRFVSFGFNSNLSSAKFIRADVTGSMFNDSDLTSADFTLANICGANFSNSILRGTDFTQAQYDNDTLFPIGFDPERNGLNRI